MTITRRASLITLASLPSLPLTALAKAAKTRQPAGPPVARVEPVSETFFGQAVVDPYRWMENPKDARVGALHARPGCVCARGAGQHCGP